MQGLRIELTRTERAVELAELELNLKGMSGVGNLCQLNSEDKPDYFHQIKDSEGRIDPLYEIEGDFSLTDIVTLVNIKGFKVSDVQPYQTSISGEGL